MSDCKKLYKSLRDAARYKRKKTVNGKSGDSGDEQSDMETDDCEAALLDGENFAFLATTASKHPRLTKSLGNLLGDDSQEGNSSQFDSTDSATNVDSQPINADSPPINVDEIESNYSYV